MTKNLYYREICRRIDIKLWMQKRLYERLNIFHFIASFLTFNKNENEHFPFKLKHRFSRDLMKFSIMASMFWTIQIKSTISYNREFHIKITFSKIISITCAIIAIDRSIIQCTFLACENAWYQKSLLLRMLSV